MSSKSTFGLKRGVVRVVMGKKKRGYHFQDSSTDEIQKLNIGGLLKMKKEELRILSCLYGSLYAEKMGDASTERKRGKGEEFALVTEGVYNY